MIRGGVKLGKNLRSTATECRLRPDGTRITLASAGTKWSRPPRGEDSRLLNFVLRCRPRDTFTALLRKSLIINGAGEGNRTLIPDRRAAGVVRKQFQIILGAQATVRWRNAGWRRFKRSESNRRARPLRRANWSSCAGLQGLSDRILGFFS